MGRQLLRTEPVKFTTGSINNFKLKDKRRLGDKEISISDLSPARISWLLRITKNNKLNKFIENNERLYLAREILNRVFVHRKVTLLYAGQYSHLNPYSPKAIKLLGANHKDNDFDWEKQFNDEVTDEDIGDIVLFERQQFSRQINRAMNIFDEELVRLKRNNELDSDLEKLRILMNKVPSHEELIKAGAIFSTNNPEELPIMIERSRNLANKPLIDFEDQLSIRPTYGGLSSRVALGLSKLKFNKRLPFQKLYDDFKSQAARYPWSCTESLQSEGEFIKDLSKSPFTNFKSITDIDIDVHGGHRAIFELNNSNIVEFFENEHRLRSPYLKELKSGDFDTGRKKIGYRVYKKTMADLPLHKAALKFYRTREYIKGGRTKALKQEFKKLKACPYKAIKLLSTTSEVHTFELANGQFLKVFRQANRDPNKNYRVESYMSYPPGKNQKNISNEKVPTRYGTFTCDDGDIFDYVIQDRLSIDRTGQNSMNWISTLSELGYTYFSKGYAQMGFLGDTPYLLDLGAYINTKESILTQLITAIEEKNIKVEDIEFCGVDVERKNRQINYDYAEARLIIVMKKKEQNDERKIYGSKISLYPYYGYRNTELCVSKVYEFRPSIHQDILKELHSYEQIPLEQVQKIVNQLKKRNIEFKQRNYI